VNSRLGIEGGGNLYAIVSRSVDTVRLCPPERSFFKQQDAHDRRRWWLASGRLSWRSVIQWLRDQADLVSRRAISYRSSTFADPLNTSVVLTFCSLSLLDLAAYELLNRGGTDVRRFRKSSPPQAVALRGDSCRRGSRGAFCGVCPAARPAAATDGFSGPTAASGPASASASGCPRRTGLVTGARYGARTRTSNRRPNS